MFHCRQVTSSVCKGSTKRRTPRHTPHATRQMSQATPHLQVSQLFSRARRKLLIPAQKGEQLLKHRQRHASVRRGVCAWLVARSLQPRQRRGFTASVGGGCSSRANGSPARDSGVHHAPVKSRHGQPARRNNGDRGSGTGDGDVVGGIKRDAHAGIGSALCRSAGEDRGAEGDR